MRLRISARGSLFTPADSRTDCRTVCWTLTQTPIRPDFDALLFSSWKSQNARALAGIYVTVLTQPMSRSPPLVEATQSGPPQAPWQPRCSDWLHDIPGNSAASDTSVKCPFTARLRKESYAAERRSPLSVFSCFHFLIRPVAVCNSDWYLHRSLSQSKKRTYPTEIGSR